MTAALLLAIAAIAALAYAANAYRIDATNARHRARHEARLRAVAESRLAAAITDRDEAFQFADECSLLLALDRHPAGAEVPARRLEVVR
jgi:hypothetical protein